MKILINHINRNTRPHFYPKTYVNDFFRSKGLVLLFSLLIIDLAFMSLHALKSLGYLNNPNFSVTESFGYAETFQYLKALFLAVFFFLLGKKNRRPLFYCWSAIFTYVLLDDSLEVHEYLGYQFSIFSDQHLPMIGIGKSSAEILVFGFFGLLVFTPLIYYFFKSEDRQTKIATQDLFILFCGMIFFGIGVDLLHDFATTGTFINGILGLAEDGGEMLIMSLIIWYTWTFAEEKESLAQSAQKEHRIHSFDNSAKRKAFLKDRAAISTRERQLEKTANKKERRTRRRH